MGCFNVQGHEPRQVGIIKLVQDQGGGMESKLQISRIIHRYRTAFIGQPQQNNSTVVRFQSEIISVMFFDQVPGPESFLRTRYTLATTPPFKLFEGRHQQH